MRFSSPKFHPSLPRKYQGPRTIPSSAAFPDTLLGSWIGSRESGTQTGAPVRQAGIAGTEPTVSNCQLPPAHFEIHT